MFLVSFLNPFLIAKYYFASWGQLQIMGNVTITFWSYKAFSSNGNEVFTKNYWFNSENPAFDSLGVTWLLIVIFSLQILTLIFGIFSLLKTKKIRIIPFVSSFIIVLLMIQVYVNVRGVGIILEKAYQSGYWLTCLSLFAFLGSFIFHLYSNREKNSTHPHIL
jgi:hypothetical protein